MSNVQRAYIPCVLVSEIIIQNVFRNKHNVVISITKKRWCTNLHLVKRKKHTNMKEFARFVLHELAGSGNMDIYSLVQ